MRRRVTPVVVAALAAFLTISGFTALTSAAHADGTAMVSCAGLPDTLAANDDGSTSAVTLPFTPDFFGTQYSQLYVNNNGNVTFNGPQATFTPFTLAADTPPIIAPFFADVDTRGAGSGLVHYGATTFGTRQAFEVCWEDVTGTGVGYYGSHTDKLNNFQMLLVDRSDIGVGDFDIIFNYRQVQWETGDASGGVDGFGGTSAGAGFSAGDGNPDHFLQINGSLQNGAFLDSNHATGLAYVSRNSTLPGRQVFPVRNGVTGTAEIAGTVTGADDQSPVVGAPVQICRAANGHCVFFGTTTAGGAYDASALLPDTYDITVFPPVGRSLSSASVHNVTVGAGDSVREDLQMAALPGAPPPGTTITNPNGTDRGTTSDGHPVVYWGDPLHLHTSACAGASMTYQIVLADGTVAASGAMVPGAATAGTQDYDADVAPLYPNHGDATVHFLFTCPGDPNQTDVNFGIYIDPSGTVIDQNSNPVAGATVTLLRSDSDAGPFAPVPDGSPIMSPGNRNNPSTTGADGQFAWDVTAGFYKVEATKEGCTDVTTGAFEIPPPVTGLSIRLDCTDTGDDTPPTVDAGPNVTGLTNRNLALKGSASDDTALQSTTWSLPAGTPCTVADPSAPMTTINCTVAGDYVATLTAMDTSGHSASDDTTVHVSDPDTANRSCHALTASIVGTNDSDVIYGTPGPDVIVALAGNDTVYGGGGADTICTNAGADTIYGQTGADLMDAGADNDRLIGGQGDDYMIGGRGNDVLHGQAGNDTINGNAGDDRERGGADNDRIFGEAGNDLLIGNGGTNTLVGGTGTDTCGSATDGTDTFRTCEVQVT